MSSTLSKQRIITALHETARPGIQTNRAVDKLLAAINRGDYDGADYTVAEPVHVIVADDSNRSDFVETETPDGKGIGSFEQFIDPKTGLRHIVIPRFVQQSEQADPEVVVHAAAVINHANEHDKATVFAAEYIMARHEGRPAPTYDQGKVVGKAKAEEEKAKPISEVAAVKKVSEALSLYVDAAHEPGQYVVVDWATAIHLRYIGDEAPDWAGGLPEMVTYATEPSGSIVAEIGMLQTIHERLVRIAANGNQMAKGE